MKKLHFSITIDAPPEQVYKTMLDKPTYEQWTSVFSPDPSDGSTYEGSWDQGSEVKFGDSQGNGMIATVVENRPNDFVSLKHHTMVIKGKETTIDPPMLEKYTFTEEDGGQTKLDVDLDMEEKYAEMFNDMWPKGLDKLKEIAEASK